MSIEVQHVSKRFGDFVAVNDVNVRIPTSELVALLGPSGSGKTTLLRIIAGLEPPDEGVVLLDGERADGRSVRERGVGFVFQHYALFRHMTVFDNVAFGLQVRPRAVRPSRRAIREKVQSLLALVHLDTMASRYPSQLSGGQRQRVALARALAVEPQVLLLDEPFGSLDAKVRLELRRWLRRLHDELHVTSVFVTHDQEEAMEVADTVVVMNKGHVEQIGTPEEVYQNPANPFVYNFLGNVNLFRGRVREGRVSIGGIEIDSPEHAGLDDEPVVGYARPHDLEIDRSANGEGAIVALVRRVHALGPSVRVELEHGDTGDLIEAHLSRERQADLALKAGERVAVRPRNVRVFLGENI